MLNSKELAKLIGPTISVMTISEMINFHIWNTNIPAVTYLNGIILFLAGLSIIRIHNIWAGSWRTIITVAGWFGIFGGLFRIFFPEARQAENSIGAYVVISFLLLIGLFLTFKGYNPEKKARDTHAM